MRSCRRATSLSAKDPLRPNAKDRKPKTAGITMGELLFVAGLVILACAILTYVWLHTGTASRHRVCASNVRQLGTAMLEYAMDHDDTFPAYGNIGRISVSGRTRRVAPQPALPRASSRVW